MYYEENPSPQALQAKKRKKQKQGMTLIALILIGGLVYYFLSHLPDERKRTKQTIEEAFKDNYRVLPENLINKENKKPWGDAENWEAYLNSLLLPSQVKDFEEKMLKAIEKKAEELEQEEKDRPRKMKEKAIEDVKAACTEAELELPEVKKIIEQCTEKIDKTSLKELDKVKKQAIELIEQERFKRQGLHWRRQINNWADRWLIRNKQSFEKAWTTMSKMLGEEPPSLDINGVYRIQFPPSLWNNLSEEKKALAEENGHSKLILEDEVKDYKFSRLIENWEEKVKPDPTRGKFNPKDPSNLDNNALFYGAPRTGKSVMAEKLAYESNKYPLVVIQGSTLTPRKPDNEAGVSLLIKFIYTISTITHDLVDNYGFVREGDGEVRYILFIDEADQICTTYALPPNQASSQLTFLKECMGSDSKKEESKNLWIAATNHLDNINQAVYQSGRLSNPLDFSWTLGEFMYYASKAGISSQFPAHWQETKTLNDEDNQWVNRFNKIIFDRDFLGKEKEGNTIIINPNKAFWNKFINNNPNAEYEPEREEENNEDQEDDNNERNKKVKIKWGEFFEFFWRLYDSKQLESFEGKFENPRNPKIEEVLAGVNRSLILTTNKLSKDICKALDSRLNELNDTATEIRDAVQTGQADMSTSIDNLANNISIFLTEIGTNMRGRNSN